MGTFLLLAGVVLLALTALWALDTLTGCVLTYVASWNAQKNVTGLNPISQNGTLSKKATFATSVANAALGGGNEVSSFVQSIGTSASVSIDLTSLTEVTGATGVTLARVKAILIHLLSATDDATNGSAASSVTIDNTVTNALSSQSGTGWFGNAAEGGANGSKFVMPNGAFLAFGVPNAAGVAVDSTHRVIKLTNADAGVVAKVRVVLIGGST